MDESDPPTRASTAEPARLAQGLWLGPCFGELGLLSELLCQHRPIERPPGLDCLAGSPRPELERLVRFAVESQPSLQRIILSCPGRLDYPVAWIEFLNAEFPEIPTAVALGAWWDGAARTGLRNRPVLSIPWHRVWDGWLPWLLGTATSLVEVCPHVYAYAQLQWPVTAACAEAVGEERADVAASRWACGDAIQNPPPTALSTSGLIVCGKSDQAKAWSDAAASAGFPCLIKSSRNWTSASPGLAIEWILLDDSACDTASGSSVSLVALGGELRAAYPGAAIACATHFPRLELYSELAALQVDAVFTKPGTGMGLVLWLSHHFARARSSAALPRR
ncbi:MAG: hypothetical protein D6753_07815 [Planctomycetota bacterium]|nr:MAG: hypothetical protein D6753_07815 [Planctomycetota bacterium]